MTPEIQTLLNAATSFDSLLQDQRDLVHVYLLSQQYSVTDSAQSVLNKVADLAELTPEQQQMVTMFAIAKNKGLDTNAAGLVQTVVNNLGSIQANWNEAAKLYVTLRGLAVLAAG